MDQFLAVLNFNESVDYGTIFFVITIYFASLWLMISLWVGRDAYRRYDTYLAAALWGLVVFFLNFPAFMFYLLVRPEDLEDASTGGVHIPIANFVDSKKDEVVIGLQMVLHTRELTDAVKDMRIDIDWESDDPAKKITPESIDKETKEVERKLAGLGKIYGSLKSKLDETIKELPSPNISGTTDTPKESQDGSEKKIEHNKPVELEKNEAPKISEALGNKDNAERKQDDIERKDEGEKKEDRQDTEGNDGVADTTSSAKSDAPVSAEKTESTAEKTESTNEHTQDFHHKKKKKNKKKRRN